MKKGSIEDPTILEAVDNLSSMAELNIEELKVERSEEGGGARISRWLDLKDEAKTVESVKNTFKVVHKYLQHIYSTENQQLKDLQIQKGVKSIIALAEEAAHKIEASGVYFQGKELVTQSKEYLELMDFYQKKILKKFEDVIKLEEEWQQELGKVEDVADIERRGLKDLESVTRDRDYELFFITKEDGSKFYNRNLLRHVRLVTNFDHLIGNVAGDDPLLKIKMVQDKEALETARSFKEKLGKDLDGWFKEAGKFRDEEFVRLFYRAVMALLLASNPRNLLSRTTGKSSLIYFADFQYYLRATLSHMDYQSFVEGGGKELDPFYNSMLSLMHKLTFLFFVNPLDQSDALACFTRIIQEKENPKNKSTTSSLFLWNRILDEHEELHRELMKFPSGPLFKVIDILHDKEDVAFDPFIQYDRPQALFQLSMNGKRVTVTRMASPTRQKQIQEAKIIPEFTSALRHAVDHKEKILLVNYQDRTSWKEYARTKELETLQNNAEVERALDVVTLPKNTEFYLQSEEYLKDTNAGGFKKVFFEQITSEENCGFSFPSYISHKDLYSFIKQAIEMTHSLFFGDKEELSRKNRLDFIEIVYQWILIKLLIETKASILTFSAKDGVDLPSAASFGFFAFLKLVGNDPLWKEEEKDFLNALVFVPALLIRERVIDRHPLSRMISMLSVLSAELELNRKKVSKTIAKLYAPHFSDGISVHHLF